MNESLAQVVSSLGLSPEQARVYLILVDHGPQIVSELAIKAQVQRTYIYTICRQLIEMGLATEEKQGKITRYSALSPDRLLDLVESKKTQLSQTQRTLEGILPTLKAKYVASETKPVVTYFEGVEGVKKIYMDTIHEGKEILAILQPTKIDNHLEDWLKMTYVKLRKASGVGARVLVAGTEKANDYIANDVEYLRETKIIPEQTYPLGHEINIYGSKIAMINNLEGEKLLGVIINNTSISQTFKSWFELTWIKL